MTKSKTAVHLQDWLSFFSKYMHLVTPEQEESLIVDMISGKAPPKDFKPKDTAKTSLAQVRKQISATIKKYREASGMGQGEFAKSIGRSLPYISLIESGKRTPNILDLQKTMKILKIPADEIFTVLFS